MGLLCVLIEKLWFLDHYVPAHEGNGSDAITTSEVSGIPGPCGVQLEEPTPTEQASFQVNDDVELLIQDLDMPDCWCKCKIMDISKRRWKVQCNDMMDADGSGKLEVQKTNCFKWSNCSILNCALYFLDGHNFLNSTHKLSILFTFNLVLDAS